MLSPIETLFSKPLAITFFSRKYKNFFGSSNVVDEGQYIRINYFPYKWFNRKIKELYHTTKIQHLYEVVGFVKIFGRTSIRVHKFFIPEIIYILSQCGQGRPQDIIRDLVENTWVKDVFAEDEDIPSSTNMDRISTEMNCTLFDWQEEFIRIYDKKRRRAHLNGELLSFGCGLGKTITSLATMTSIGCDAVIVIAPKSTLVDVWVDHISRFYKKQQKYYLVNRDEPKDAKFFIFNYESMDKVAGVMKYLSKKNKIGIIVDESHNFLKSKSLRTQNLVQLVKDLRCENCLLMSGTPVKAIGQEVLALLSIIDPLLDQEARDIFAKALGINTTIGADILHARLNMVMHRRTMDEVYSLPEKTERSILVKMANAKDYTIPEVKKTLEKFMNDRLEYHKKRMPIYEQYWDESLTYLMRQKSIVSSDDFARYMKFVKYVRKNGYDRHDKWVVTETVWANKYEKDVLIPALPKQLKDKFIECKSKIKYLDLCIQGEILGYLDNLRSQMAVRMLDSVDIEDIVDHALKKVIFATTYVEVVEALKKRCESLGYNPLCVYGKTSKDAPAILEKFRKDDSCSVLIATMQTLSTGVTLTEANTIVFCNRDWRHANNEQMEHRVYRIGQDTPCEIIKLILDTGKQENLSDRLEEVVSWSKEMTDAIVDGK